MKKIQDVLFLLPGLSIYILFMVIPVGICLFYSFTNWDGLSASFRFIGLKNFSDLASDLSFLNALKATLILTIVHTFVVNFFGMLIAVWLDGMERTKRICKSLLFIPAILSSVVVSFIWAYMTQTNGGIINYLFGLVGLPAFDFFKTNLSITMMVTFVIAWAGLGFYITVYDAALKTVPIEVYESCRVDGAGRFRTFFNITMPLLTPGITVCTLFSMIACLKQYDFVKIMTPGSVQTIAVNAVERFFQYNMLGYSSAIVSVLFVLTVLVTLVQTAILKKHKVEY